MIKITFHNGVDIETKEFAQATEYENFGGSVDLNNSDGGRVFSCCASRFICLEVINKED